MHTRAKLYVIYVLCYCVDSVQDARILPDGVIVNVHTSPVSIHLNGGCAYAAVFGKRGYYTPQLLLSRVSQPASRIVHTAVVLNGRWAYGYFHFMTEVSYAHWHRAGVASAPPGT